MTFFIRALPRILGWVLLGVAAAWAAVAPTVPPGSAAPALPHGLRGAVEIPDPWRWWRLGAVGALVLAICLLGFWLWWRRRGTASGPTGPRPDDVARARLQRALEYLDQPKIFVAEVSSTVREYLEARFGLRAPERTTEEFIQELQTNGALATPDRESLERFLGACDLVKFAGVRPGRSELEELHTAAMRVVNELTPAAPPPNLPAPAPLPAQPPPPTGGAA